MGTGAKALGLAVMFAISVGLFVDAIIPDTKVVTEEHTIVKTKTVHVTETKTIKENLPDSCVRAIDLLSELVSHQGEITKQSGELVAATQRAQVLLASGSHARLVTEIETMTHLREGIDSSIVSNSEKMNDATNQLRVCLEEVKK